MNRKRLAAFWAISAGLAVVDVASKYLVFSLVEVSPGRGPEIIPGFLYLTCRLNPGFSWSLLRGLPPQLTAIINLAIIALVVYYYFYGRDVRHNRLTFAAVVLIMGGALGNLYDRLFYSGVRDFIDVIVPLVAYDYPVFNVADVFVVVGVGLFILEALLEWRKEKRAGA